jgi:hypothetical protein
MMCFEAQNEWCCVWGRRINMASRVKKLDDDETGPQQGPMTTDLFEAQPKEQGSHLDEWLSGSSFAKKVDIFLHRGPLVIVDRICWTDGAKLQSHLLLAWNLVLLPSLPALCVRNTHPFILLVFRNRQIQGHEVTLSQWQVSPLF